VKRQELLAVDGDIARGLDAETNLSAIDVHYRDADIVSDVDLFPELTTEYEHGGILR
jgi:hypothetical protein